MASVCEPILRSLPEWFGSEPAILQYLKDIDALPTLLARSGDEITGFLTLKEHTPYAAEILVMGVRREQHRKGTGRRLVLEAQRFLRNRGVEYLQVKTLSDADPDEPYARTREFYRALDFRPLQEFEGLWDPGNPCLQMIKCLVDYAP